jgi:hypothetical protein
VPHQRGDDFDKKQELRDYIDPFESLGTKLTSGAKFEDKNAYFALREVPSKALAQEMLNPTCYIN